MCSWLCSSSYSLHYNESLLWFCSHLIFVLRFACRLELCETKALASGRSIISASCSKPFSLFFCFEFWWLWSRISCQLKMIYFGIVILRFLSLTIDITERWWWIYLSFITFGTMFTCPCQILIFLWTWSNNKHRRELKAVVDGIV